MASLQNEELCKAIAAEIFKPNVTLRSDVLNLANDNPVRAEKLKELNSSLDSTKLLLEQLQPIDQGSEEQEERSDLSAVITCIEQLRDEEEELVELDDWNTYSQATLAGLQGFLQEYQGVHGSFPDIFKSQEAKCLKKLEETYIEGLKTEAVKGKLKIYSASLEHTTPKSKPAAKGKEASISKPKSDGAYNEASNNSAKSEKVNNGVIIYNSLVGAGIALITIAVAVFIIGEGKKSELARRLTGAFLVLGAISAVAAIITRCLTPGTAMQAAQVSANTVANPGK